VGSRVVGAQGSAVGVVHSTVLCATQVSLGLDLLIGQMRLAMIRVFGQRPRASHTSSFSTGL
jgi:hypothetical protein